MKKSQSLTSLLGLSQDELALILKVSRTTFSMYELGSRRLPLASTQLLAEMVEYICGTATGEKVITHPAEQLAQKQKAVQKMLKENDYQQMATARKISSVETKYTAKIKALQLVDYLSQSTSAKEGEEQAILRAIAHKATKSLQLQGLDVLFKLQLKLEMLQLEKLLLDNEIRKMLLAQENREGKA